MAEATTPLAAHPAIEAAINRFEDVRHAGMARRSEERAALVAAIEAALLAEREAAHKRGAWEISAAHREGDNTIAAGLAARDPDVEDERSRRGGRLAMTDTPLAARLEEIGQAIDDIVWLHGILSRLGDDDVVEAAAFQIRALSDVRHISEVVARAALAAALAKAMESPG